MFYNFIELLRFFATILITNSHYNNIWPIYALATGGSLGNTLFFAISGFCLSAPPKGENYQWIKRRLARIYPPVLIMTLIQFVFIENQIDSFSSFIRYFLYPTPFWFASAILLFYLLYYLFSKLEFIKKYYIIAFCVVLYIILYVFVLDTSKWCIEGYSSFKWIYYFIVFIVSNIIKEKKYINRIKIPGLLLILSLILYFGFKYILTIQPFVMHFQFILHIISLFFMVGCFGVGYKNEEFFKAHKNGKIFKIVSFIGNMSFEIYLVQTLIISKFEKYIFPLNLLIVTSLIIIFGFLLSVISKGIRKVILNRRNTNEN